MSQRSTSKSGENFIRVVLHSGTSGNPLGDEELAIFCRCSAEAPSITDVDTDGLIIWVNSNPACKRNQSNERYKLSRQADAVAVIFLSDREILSCKCANRIFPS